MNTDHHQGELTMTTTPDTDTIYAPSVVRDLLRQITNEFRAMPYGGLAHFRHAGSSLAVRRPEPMTLAEVLDNLASLRSVLEGVARREQDRDAEVMAARRDLDAVGRVLRGVRDTIEEATR